MPIEIVYDDGESLELWFPTDDWIASQIRYGRGWPDSRPVPAGLIAGWRAAMKKEALRQRRWRKRIPDARIPMPPPRRRPFESISDSEFALEILTHPYMVMMLSAMVIMPLMLADAMSDAGTLFRPPPRWQLTPLINYIRSKKSTPGPALITHARHRRIEKLWYAAVNAMSPADIVVWDERLTHLAASQRHDAAAAAMDELDEMGSRAVEVVAPLRIDRPEPGPPRNLFPPPPATVVEMAEKTEGLGHEGASRGSAPPAPAPSWATGTR